jgi:hypothetical protein
MFCATSAARSLADGTAHAQGNFGMAGKCGQHVGALEPHPHHQASQWLPGHASGMNAAMKSEGTTPLASHQQLGAEIDRRRQDANPANLANAANEWYATVPKQTDLTAGKDPSDNS